jgi:hypothetical protein
MEKKLPRVLAMRTYRSKGDQRIETFYDVVSRVLDLLWQFVISIMSLDRVDAYVHILMRPGVLRKGAAAFASIVYARTQPLSIAIAGSWAIGLFDAGSESRSQRVDKVSKAKGLVLFRFSYNALSGI